MTTKILYPKLDYVSHDREFIVTASTYTRNYSYGDAGFVDIEFPIEIIDKATNMICMEVTYNIFETSFENQVSVDKLDRRQDTIDFIVSTEGCFVEPDPPGKELVLELLDRLIKYLQEYAERYLNKTLFSSENSIEI